MPKDYRDYVFKDGVLVGEFDRMYQESENVPWHQDKTAFSLVVDFDISILKKYIFNKNISILDNGCGVGYVTDRLKKELSVRHVSGSDISENAITKAAELHEGIDFFVKDMLSEPSKGNQKYDLIYMKDILWYVVDGLEVFMRNILSMLEQNGMIFVMQTFPESESYYGKEAFPNPESILQFLEKYFEFKYKSIIKENYNVCDANRIPNDYRHEYYVRFFGLRKDNNPT